MAYTKSRTKRRKNKYRNQKASGHKLILLIILCCIYLYFFSSLNWNDFPKVAQGEIRIEEFAEKLLPAKEEKAPKVIWNIYRDISNYGIEYIPEMFFEWLNTWSRESNGSQGTQGTQANQSSSGSQSARTYEPPISLDEIPDYYGDAYQTINGGVPSFTEEELADFSCNYFADLDDLGRCGRTQVMLSPKTMPKEARGEIGMVKPSGWHTVKYAGIDGNYLYNRCHLIGFQLSGENANVKNLITGTRYLNVIGMLPFENAIADYIRKTGNHVLYRVTPIFEGSNLVADGVLMEATSIEDDGAGIYFNIFCYNVQPGVTIDYATGDSSGPAYG